MLCKSLIGGKRGERSYREWKNDETYDKMVGSLAFGKIGFILLDFFDETIEDLLLHSYFYTHFQSMEGVRFNRSNMGNSFSP